MRTRHKRRSGQLRLAGTIGTSLVAGALVLVAAAMIAWLPPVRHASPQQPASVSERLPGTPSAGVIVQSQPKPMAEQMRDAQNALQVTLSDTGIAPAQLQGQLGVELRLHVRNQGTKPHNFLLPDFGIITQPMQPGAENYIAFTPSRPGTFRYFSGDPRQRVPEPGLEGRLVVTP